MGISTEFLDAGGNREVNALSQTPLLIVDACFMTYIGEDGKPVSAQKCRKPLGQNHQEPVEN
jgi:hypothetical protein